MQTELVGPGQATDPAAMSLAEYVAEGIQLLGCPTLPRGEILLERARTLRWVERNGEYDDKFAALNPQ